MGLILGCYNWAYALFQIPGGWFGDRAGPRIALASVVVWWSVFTFITGFSVSVTMMMVCLFLIGMGEAGAFPISNRALSRWMLPTERGFAQGATHAGSRLAGAATPDPGRHPDRALWLARALLPVRRWSALSGRWCGSGIIATCPASMPASMRPSGTRSTPRWASAKKRQPIPWKLILCSRQMWTVAAMYFCYGYCLNMFLAWYPKYLDSARAATR